MKHHQTCSAGARLLVSGCARSVLWGLAVLRPLTLLVALTHRPGRAGPEPPSPFDTFR